MLICEICVKKSKQSFEELNLKRLNKNEDIPWARIIGLRNLVIHEYFGIDDITIWNVIKINLPFLKEKIEVLISEID